MPTTPSFEVPLNTPCLRGPARLNPSLETIETVEAGFGESLYEEETYDAYLVEVALPGGNKGDVSIDQVCAL